MAQPPPNVFKKDIVANAATLPPSHAVPHAAASAAAGNASPSNHILPTSALMAGVCVLVMALAKLIKLRSGSGLMDLAMAANSVFFLISAVCSFISMRAGKMAAFLERVSDVVFVLGLLLLVLFGFGFAVDLL